ncbi:MAG: hypothetical protein FJW39_07810 [Acidobacteria bacterium]|nr:hypothetical protein [Acidobacteriota bacterium]
MFDLFRSRDTAMRWVLVVLLSLVALSMVITLVPGFGSGGSMSRRDDVLAEACGEQVTQRMVAQVVAQQMRAREFASAMAEFLIPRMVDQFVGELATSCAAQQLGLSAGDGEVASYIQSRMPALWQDGQFVGTQAYQQYLSQMNTTIPEFEKRVRQQILLDKLQRIAFDGIVVTPREVEAEFSRKGEKARLEVVKFDPAEQKKGFNPSKDELEAYLKANQGMFQVAPKKTVSLVVADADRLGAAIAVTDAQVAQLYEQQQSKFRVEERVKVRHILIKAGEKDPADKKAKAKQKAEDLLKQIKGGADFAELAKKNSEDPGSGSKGGDLDWVQRGQMVKPFEEAAFKLKPKELSGIVETVFGYHIVQTTERQDARIKPLAEVKNEVISEYRKQQVFGTMPELAEKAQVELSRAPGQAAAIAAKLGLLYVKAEAHSPGDPFPELGLNPDLDGLLSSMEKGAVTQVVQPNTPGGGKLYVAVVDEVIPGRPAALADMEQRVRDSYLERKGADRAEELAKQFDEKMKANGGDLKKAAAEMGLKVIDTGEFERSGQMKDVGPAGYFGEQPFTMEVGKSVGIYRVGSMPFYFRLAERKAPDLSKIEADRGVLVSSIKERKLRERRELFEAGVIESLKAKGKITLYPDRVKRLAQTYTNRG